jgi:hypothetical protein
MIVVRSIRSSSGATERSCAIARDALDQIGHGLRDDVFGTIDHDQGGVGIGGDALDEIGIYRKMAVASLLVVKPAILVRYPPLSAGMGIRLADTHPDGDAKGLAATAEMAGGLSRTPPSWGLAAGRNLTSQSTTKEPVLLSFWS